MDNTHLPCSRHCGGCIGDKCSIGYDDDYTVGSGCVDCSVSLPRVNPIPPLPLCPACLEAAT